MQLLIRYSSIITYTNKFEGIHTFFVFIVYFDIKRADALLPYEREVLQLLLFFASFKT